MKTEIKNTTASRIILSCTIEPDEMQHERNKIVRKFTSTKTIPGFRKGKVPRDRLVKAFSGEIERETINSAISTYYQNAATELKLKIFELINIDDVEPSADGSIQFKATIDLEPEFELPDYEGIPVDNQDTVITDERVDEELKSFRQSMATFEDFTDETIAAIDDMLNISYSGMIDGKPLAEAIPEAAAYATKESSWCTVGSEYYMIPGLPKELEGAKLGTEGKMTVEFPSDFYKEELKGKTVDYTYTVKEGRHLIVPEITEAFLQTLNLKTEEELRTRIRTHLEDTAKHQDKERRFRQIIEFLVKATPFDLPLAQLERSTEDALNRLIQYGVRQGVSKEDIETEREKLMETARETADAQMRTSFVIGKISEKLGTKLSDTEFNQFINEVFTDKRFTQAQAQKAVKDRDQMRALYTEALKNKVLETLLEKAMPSDGMSA